MTEAELRELEQAHAATSRNWCRAEQCDVAADVFATGGTTSRVIATFQIAPGLPRRADADFAVMAWRQIPALLAEVRRMRALMDAIGRDALQDSSLAVEAVRRERESLGGVLVMRKGETVPCQHEDCDGKRPAETIASGRELDPGGHPKPAFYCRTHANSVQDENNPEYHDHCPNCGCEFGVN